MCTAGSNKAFVSSFVDKGVRRVGPPLGAWAQATLSAFCWAACSPAGQPARTHHTLSSRDLLHLAVMHRLGVIRIVTADADFDRAPGIIRVDPAYDSEW